MSAFSETTGDAREGQSWSALQRVKNDLIYAIITICLFFVGFCSRSTLRAIGGVLGRIAYRVLGRERCTARENLARAFPDLDDEARDDLARRAFASLGRDLGEAAHAMTSGRFEPMPVAAADARVLKSAVEDGRGVLFVSAHLGPWEQVAASIVAAGFPLTTIARESYDPRLTSVYDALRGKHGVRSIYRGAASASVRAMRVLRSGGVLGVVMDLKSRVQSIEVPFLGVDAPTAIGPARLALRSGARVVVASAAPAASASRNEPLRVTVTAIDTSDLTLGADGERELTCRLNAEISRRILDLPDRWVWMHPRF